MTSKITPAVLELSKKLKEDIALVDGKPTIKADSYVNNLPDDLSKEDVKKVHDYNSLFYPAVTHAFGEVATEEMKEDKKIEDLKLEVPLWHKDHFDIHIQRERTYPIPKSDKSVTKYAQTTVGLVTKSAEGNRGDMAQVRDYLAAEALKAFGK